MACHTPAMIRRTGPGAVPPAQSVESGGDAAAQGPHGGAWRAAQPRHRQHRPLGCTRRRRGSLSVTLWRLCAGLVHEEAEVAAARW